MWDVLESFENYSCARALLLTIFTWQRRAIGNSIVAIVVEVAVVLELRTIIAGRHLNPGTSIY